MFKSSKKSTIEPFLTLSYNLTLCMELVGEILLKKGERGLENLMHPCVGEEESKIGSRPYVING